MGMNAVAKTLLETSPNCMNMSFGPDDLRKRPALLPLIAEAIALWSNADRTFYVMLANVLGVNPRPILRSLGSERNTGAQIKLLEGMVRAKLPEDRVDMFAAAITLHREGKGERDRLAHWCWGATEDLPESLLLGDPVEISDSLVDGAVRVMRALDAMTEGRLDQASVFDKARIYVYGKPELDRVIERFRAFNNIVGQLTFVTRSHGPLGIFKGHVDWATQQLTNDPMFSAALAKVVQGRTRRSS